MNIRELASPRRILIAGWVWFLVYAFPGYLSYDSYWQLIQARGEEPINDWHPPMMSFIWSFADQLIAGPLLMLVLQSTAFLLGAYGILYRFMAPRTAALVAVALLIIPPNLVVMAVIWKDSQMAGFLIAAIACLLLDTHDKGRVAACVLLFLATAMRYNAAAPTIPIIALLWDRRLPIHWARRYAAAAGVWLAITASAFIANRLLTEQQMHPWAISVPPTDIIGIIRHEPALDDDALALRMTEGVRWTEPKNIRAQAQRIYKPHRNFVDYTQMPDHVIEPPQTAAQRAAMVTAWKRMIAAYPGALLVHRIEVFKDQLANIAHVYSEFASPDWAAEALEHKTTHSFLQRTWIRAMNKVVRTELFHSRLYLLLAIALLPLCRRQRVAFAVLMSGILHELALFAIAPAIDYRYSHWMVLATMVGAVLLFDARRRLGQRTGLDNAPVVERTA